MKTVLAIILLVSSFSSFAKSKTLMSADVCRSALIYCPAVKGVSFLTDQDGRCGCVKTKQLLKPGTCLAALISCDEEKGETLSMLTDTKGKFVGCGCFATVD